MTSISTVLNAQNRAGDGNFEALHKALEGADWDTASALVNQAIAGAQRHMQTEEDVLFKTLEQMLDSEATTRPLREEHEQMRTLMAGLQQAVQRTDSDESLAAYRAMDALRRQHNAKSESHLYPLAERVLGKLGTSLAQEMSWG